MNTFFLFDIERDVWKELLNYMYLPDYYYKFWNKIYYGFTMALKSLMVSI